MTIDEMITVLQAAKDLEAAASRLSVKPEAREIWATFGADGELWSADTVRSRVVSEGEAPILFREVVE
jgi:hypothetical protein